MTTSLMKQFYVDRYLHIRSFSIQLVVTTLMCAALYSYHSSEFYHFHFALWNLALIPLGIYIGGVSAVFIHNATHNSFPNKWLNETCGYLSGLHQLWGFMGWKLIHLVHHQYSDNLAMDPHPPGDLTFWQFARQMFIHSSRKISERYREHWGENPLTLKLQKTVNIMFPIVAFANLVFWFLLLGPVGFVFFYIPSYISNHLLFVDVNYSAHPKDETTGTTAAATLTDSMYYKAANLCWFGIYYHGNHHRRPMLFNPKYMQVTERKTAKEDLDLAA